MKTKMMIDDTDDDDQMIMTTTKIMIKYTDDAGVGKGEGRG